MLTDPTWDPDTEPCVDAYVFTHSQAKDELIGRRDPDAKEGRAIELTGKLCHGRLAV